MPRKLQALGKDAPTVESSLDDFISRAHDSVQPASKRPPTVPPPPNTHGGEREQALQQQVAALEARLSALKARHRPSQGWGKLVIGFVLGCGSMFAVSALMPHESAPAKQTTAAPTAAAGTPIEQAPPAPPNVEVKVEVTPIEPPPSVAATPPPVAAAPAAPVTPAPVEPPPKPIKKRHASPQPPSEKPPTDKPPPEKGSDNLYNPF